MNVLLRRHNLNLLPILRELLRTRSVARTAETVGLSQSAVSTALARLRETYCDELLVMVGRKLELTERGRELVQPTERACQEIESLLRPSNFDPLNETRRFVVCAADYITYLLAPGLTAALSHQAPKASIHFVDYGPDLTSQLALGSIDLLAIPESSAGTLKSQGSGAALFSDEIVVISSKQKPFRGKLTREAYETARHAMFRMSSKKSSSHEARILRKVGIKQEDVVLVEQFLTLPAIVEASDCLALVQRRLAERFQQIHDIAIHAAPFETEPLNVMAFWSGSTDRDPTMRWFREQVVAVSRDL